MYSKLLALFTLVASAAAITADASYYDGTIAQGACADKHPTIGAGQYGLALTEDLWDDTAHCGASINVRGPNGNTISCVVIDRCPSCYNNKLDLLSDAFAQLANPDVGIIQVDWEWA